MIGQTGGLFKDIIANFFHQRAIADADDAIFPVYKLSG
ncbi:hypothetical protein ykris0001_1840 [Yersinia kristensenii ATCC 33638]|nr:hypothetical protein ykris0001_1840 [Yersinia kristensenii ATCC 33638]